MEKGGYNLYYSNIYNNILFITIICSSFFIVSFTAGMSKKASLFKLTGFAFLIPFGLCSSIYALTNTPVDYILSISEFCLAIGIFLLLLIPYRAKDHNLKALAIIAVTFVLASYIIGSEKFYYYTWSAAARCILTALFVSGAIILNKKINGDRTFTISLIMWLISILFGLMESRQFIRELILLTKISTCLTFIYYFYNTIYNDYAKKIDELHQLKETMEHSLHKEVRKRVFEIERSNERLLEMSKTDLLTNTFNKITILSIIEKLISKKKEEKFSILMFDIDNFKTINDSLGHVTGDICLKTLANIASSNIREVDYLGRYGGDEFIIVLSTLSENEAKFVAERFRKKVSETNNPRMTISIGIATYPKDGLTAKELISAADKALYRAKSNGKNSIFHVSHF